MTKKDIISDYLEIRKTNNTIPDEVLDFMRDAAIEKFSKANIQFTFMDFYNKVDVRADVLNSEGYLSEINKELLLNYCLTLKNLREDRLKLDSIDSWSIEHYSEAKSIQRRIDWTIENGQDILNKFNS